MISRRSGISPSQLMASGPSRHPHQGTIFAFFFLLVFPFFAVFPYITVTNNPNENTRTYMTIAMVEHKTFALDDVVRRFGWTNDMARAPDKKGVPHSYSVKGPLNSFMGAPVYWAQRHIARFMGIRPPGDQVVPGEETIKWFRWTTCVLRIFTVQIPCFLFLLWFERYLRAFSRDTSLRLMAVAAAGIGTNYLGYAHMFASHSLFGVAAFIAFGMAERSLREFANWRHRPLWPAFCCGFGAAAATGFEYHGFFLSAVLGVFGLWVFRRPKGVLALGLGAAIPIGLVAFFQWKAFGSPLTPGHKFVENQQWAAEHAKGLYGVMVPTLRAIGALSFDPGYGFFGMSPYMLLGLLSALIFAWKPKGVGRDRSLQRSTTLVWLFAMVALWLTMCGAAEWRAGWTIGPRRAGAAPPFFAMGALILLERWAGGSPSSRPALRGIAGGMAYAGVLSLGFVGMHFNTLPEDIWRPFTQLTLPLARTGFVPHHIGELFGHPEPRVWWFAAIALLIAPFVALFRFGYEKKWSRLGLLLAIPFGMAASFPALYVPKDAPAFHHSGFTGSWEPTGRDRIAALQREIAKGGPAAKCASHQFADLQEVLRVPAEAAATRAAAGPRPANCRPAHSWVF